MNKYAYLNILTLFINSTISSQNKFSANIAGGAVIGLGNFGDLYETGFGGITTLLFSASETTDITISISYYKWKNENLSFSTIPVTAGLRYYFPINNYKIYVPGYIGVHFTTKETELPTAEIEGNIIGGNIISVSEKFFGYGIGIGILFPVSSKLYLNLNGTFNSFSTTNFNSIYVEIAGGILIRL